VVVGEAEGVWPQVVDDYRFGTQKPRYQGAARPALDGVFPDRSIFRGKRYLPIGLVEAARGCHLRCDFCAVTKVFGASASRRPADQVVEELHRLKDQHQLVFFVDDNITADLGAAKDLLRALIPLKLRWVSQASIHAAHDEEFLALLEQSGCQGVLIGFESLNADNLRAMNKSFNTMGGGYERALHNLRRHRIRVYGTFVFGYDHDTEECFGEALRFALDQRLYIAAFNHLTPFPGTPLFERLRRAGRLLHEAWWLDEGYSYNQVPFRPARLRAEDVARGCLAARRAFYSWPSILRRGLDRVNRSDPFMFRSFFLINALHRQDVSARDGYPLGDEAWQGELLAVA
jgi:radical SAM superfamily enzyme YgiQ (UPF0313 family)